MASKQSVNIDVNPSWERGTQRRKFGFYSAVIASILDGESRDYLQCDRELDQEEGGEEKYPSTPLLQLFCYFSISG